MATSQRRLPVLRTLAVIERSVDGTGRRLDCTGYGACLDLALELAWPSWTCHPSCGAYRQLTPEDRMQDLPGLCKLANTISLGDDEPSNDNR